MIKREWKNCILSKIAVEKNSLDTILTVFNPLELSKGEFFLKSGKICR